MAMIDRLTACLCLAVAASMFAACGAESSTARAVAPAASSATAPGWTYEVRATPDASELEIAATFSTTATSELSVDPRAESHVHDVEVLAGAEWSAVSPREGSWLIDDCSGGAGCRVRYRFELGSLAAERRSADWAVRIHRTIVTSPSSWLLRPLGIEPGVPYRFRVSGEPEFVSGVGLGRAAGQFETDSSLVSMSPYSAFGEFRRFRIAADGGVVDVAIAAGELPLADRKIVEWLDRSARGLSAYLGRFPVKRVLALVVPSRRGKIHGKQKGGGGSTILMTIGPSAAQADLDNDWRGPHEMVHLAVPSMPYRYRWITEGLATYVEPMARTSRQLRAGGSMEGARGDVAERSAPGRGPGARPNRDLGPHLLGRCVVLARRRRGDP